MTCLSIGLALLTSGIDVADKLDSGLSDVEGTFPIFVRMEDQVFKRGGDFERFCQAKDGEARSKTRKSVLATLRGKADSSWKGISKALAALEAKGGLSGVQRFWIVNGFACDATAEACKALAGRDDVSFVYLQTGPQGLRQHRSGARRAAGTDEGRKLLEEAFAAVEKSSEGEFSAAGLEIPWDLKQIQADQVWKLEGVSGKGSVVAVNDGGLHALPSLVPALWRNAKETVDGKDNDGNGYVDDVFGLDAAARNGQVFEASGVAHGTMCSGIIAGRQTSETKTVTGVAPRAKLMAINGMGYFRGMEYALANGADVFSMSYMFVNMEIGNYRGVFRLAAEHMTAAGVLLCGGAGNFATSAPEGKQITIPKDIPCVLAVAGTLEDGSRPAFSSKGPATWSGVRFYDDYPSSKPLSKPDLSAPAGGFLCWTQKGDARPQWKVEFEGSKGDVLIRGAQGNSFAGPHVAGVAALMFSANPDLQPWRAKRILEETSKDMGAPGRDYLHGAGVVQALEAVRKAKAVR